MIEYDQGARQSVFNCVVSVRPGAEGELEPVLAEHAPDALHGRGVLAGVAQLHFARFLILREARDAKRHYLPPRLVFSALHDGDIAPFLSTLTREARGLLGSVFRLCDGFGGSEASLTSYLHQHYAPPLAMYNSAKGSSVGEIRSEASLVSWLRDELGRCREADPVRVYEELIHSARTEPSLAWAFDPGSAERLSWSDKAMIWLAWLGRTWPRWLLFFLSLRALRKDEVERPGPASVPESIPSPPPPSCWDRAQSTYNILSVVRPGPARRKALHLMLDFLQTVGRLRSDLSGITTMRFLQWLELDGGRRLLFGSVYDGSFDAYLADFIDLAGWGLTGIWSNTMGFPSSEWMLFDGARREQAFRAWTRVHEAPTVFSYHAYPGLSCEHIADAVAVRQGLGGLPPAARENWLSRLG